MCSFLGDLVAIDNVTLLKFKWKCGRKRKLYVELGLFFCM